MNIIIISDYAYIEGGASAIAIDSALSFSNSGYNVIFFTSSDKADQRLLDSNVRLFSTSDKDLLNGGLASAIKGLWNFNSSKKLQLLLDLYGSTDVRIFIHSWTKSLSSSILVPIVKSNIKTDFILHDYFSVCPNGAFFNFNKSKICSYSPMSIECIICNCDSRSYSVKLWRVARQFLFNRQFIKYLNYQNNIVFVSDFSKKIMSKYFPDKYFSRVLASPIFLPNKVNKVNVVKNTKIGFIGRLSDEKGVKHLADYLLPYAHRVIFIGSGPLESYIKSKSDKYTITGWLSKDNLHAELNKLRFNIFSSVIYETDGLSIRESGSYGIPSIVSNLTAGCDYINNGENGLCYDVNSKEDLLLKIKLLDDDLALRKMSNNCFSYFNDFNANSSEYVNRLLEGW